MRPAPEPGGHVPSWSMKYGVTYRVLVEAPYQDEEIPFRA